MVDHPEDIAKMLESMGVPVQVADDGSMSVALTGALDTGSIDRLSENLKGEVEKVEQEEEYNSIRSIR